MNKEQILKALESFPLDAKVLVFNGDTLCAIDSIAEYNCTGDPDDGATVIYLEE